MDNTRTRKDSDLSYKNFFSYPVMVISLIQEYGPRYLAGIVDFSTLERLHATYISQELLERRDDIVWRVNLQNSSAYLVLILEFQSSPHNLMALRIRSYSSLLLLDIAKGVIPFKQQSLPQICPIVLYNGKEQWKVALDAEPLFFPMPDGQKQYVPQQDYSLLDECHIADDELSKSNGLVTQLIKLERAKSLDDFKPIFTRLEELLPEPEYVSLNDMFTLWAECVLKAGGFIEESRTFRNLQEVNMILGKHTIENAANWKNEYIQEGEARGGGRILRIMLQNRFGTLPETVVAYIESSDADALASFAAYAGQAQSMQAITDHIKGAQAQS